MNKRPLSESERIFEKLKQGTDQRPANDPYAPLEDLDRQRRREAELDEARQQSRRKAPSQSDLKLLPESAVWLKGLPLEVKPLKLAAHYPHVVNRICSLWTRPTHLDRYMQELLHDTRGNRKGFPLGVALELTTLHEYYVSEVYPVATTVWDTHSASGRS